MRPRLLRFGLLAGDPFCHQEAGDRFPLVRHNQPRNELRSHFLAGADDRLDQAGSVQRAASRNDSSAANVAAMTPVIPGTIWSA